VISIRQVDGREYSDSQIPLAKLCLYGIVCSGYIRPRISSLDAVPHSVPPTGLGLEQFWCNATSFRINTCELSCKCGKQVTYGNANSLRINTYKKLGGTVN